MLHISYHEISYNWTTIKIVVWSERRTILQLNNIFYLFFFRELLGMRNFFFQKLWRMKNCTNKIWYQISKIFSRNFWNKSSSTTNWNTSNSMILTLFSFVISERNYNASYKILCYFILIASSSNCIINLQFYFWYQLKKNLFKLFHNTEKSLVFHITD